MTAGPIWTGWSIISPTCAIWAARRTWGWGATLTALKPIRKALRNAGDLPALLERMRRRGFGEPLVEAVAGLNFKRYLETI